MALVIQERLQDDEKGNLPDDYSPFDNNNSEYENSRETFISKS
jgi:hypothetical protein